MHLLNLSIGEWSNLRENREVSFLLDFTDLSPSPLSAVATTSIPTPHTRRVTNWPISGLGLAWLIRPAFTSFQLSSVPELSPSVLNL
ncbi:hypothetical protein PoB_004281400 [Plakobranchus ocellatus]|uniref:Uncharacterized protein n=1 Tax=Plakobranchus ocellatus TaxID=259542 RepID=A0AAV4B8A9_9GAST|nr:hypothetical protein PoB_004281400 [Plakobranchus ocellatus]